MIPESTNVCITREFQMSKVFQGIISFSSHGKLQENFSFLIVRKNLLELHPHGIKLTPVHEAGHYFTI